MIAATTVADLPVAVGRLEAIENANTLVWIEVRDVMFMEQQQASRVPQLHQSNHLLNRVTNAGQVCFVREARMQKTIGIAVSHTKVIFKVRDRIKMSLTNNSQPFKVQRTIRLQLRHQTIVNRHDRINAIKSAVIGRAFDTCRG